MFGDKSITALSVIEAHIETLEYAFISTNTVSNYDANTLIIIELGHLYNAKMQIIKTQQNEPFINKESTNIKTYPSKINFDTERETISWPMPIVWKQCV